MYTVRQTSSEDGRTYYLYKGWGKPHSERDYDLGLDHMWETEMPHERKYLFDSPRTAQMSFTKLTQAMQKYKRDPIKIIEVKESEITG